MTITATEFKTNFGKYIDLLDTEDILITRNGKTVARLTKEDPPVVEQMTGLLSRRSGGVNAKKMKEDRLSEKYLGGHHE